MRKAFLVALLYLAFPSVAFAQQGDVTTPQIVRGASNDIALPQCKQV